MRFRTWPVAALALAGLLLLIIVSVVTARSRAKDIYTQLERLNAHHREVDAKLRGLRSDVHLSSLYVRDYLLDTEREHAPEYRQRLAAYRRTNIATLTELQTIAPQEGTRIASLQTQLDQYWQAFEPLFDWTPAEKLFLSSRFLRREVLPRREAVFAIAEEIEQLNNANLEAQRAEVTRRFELFRSDLQTLLWRSLLLGVVVAVTAVIRLRAMERRADEQRSIAEEAERQMRLLSQQLVATQEGERKKLSRELHDHVGQMLTALRMELGRIDRAKPAGGTVVPGAVAECRQLVDNVVRTVRDLALGLRPSMLDDFGLQPALEWHIRDVSRRHGVSIDLAADADFEWLPDAYRTCVYRVVQEALTNCVRHARASRVHVALIGRGPALEVSVTDDGVGFERAVRPRGLGLRGIEERVRELKGTLQIRTAPGKGTSVIITLPLPAAEEAGEAALASVAG
jgi:signal transduction histidine kinase